MSEQECRIDHFRVMLVAKAFCHNASSLKFCQTSGKFSHVDEVLSFLSMYVAAPRVLWLLRALQDCGSSCRLAIDGEFVWAAASPLPFPEIRATWQKIIAQSFRLALAWMYEAMWRASTRRLPASFVIVSL